MSVWNWVQVAVAVVAAIVGAFGKGMNKWLGFLMTLSAGVLIIVMSIVGSDYRFLGLGAFAIVLALLALIVNAAIQPQAQDDTLGGQISNLPAWAWVASGVLFVVALVPLFVLKPPANTSGAVPQTGQSEQAQTQVARKTSPKTPPKHK